MTFFKYGILVLSFLVADSAWAQGESLESGPEDPSPVESFFEFEDLYGRTVAGFKDREQFIEEIGNYCEQLRTVLDLQIEGLRTGPWNRLRFFCDESEVFMISGKTIAETGERSFRKTPKKSPSFERVNTFYNSLLDGLGESDFSLKSKETKRVGDLGRHEIHTLIWHKVL